MKSLITLILVGFFMFANALPTDNGCLNVGWYWLQSTKDLNGNIQTTRLYDYSPCLGQNACQKLPPTNDATPVIRLDELDLPNATGCSIYLEYGCTGDHREVLKSETGIAGSDKLQNVHEYKSFRRFS